MEQPVEIISSPAGSCYEREIVAQRALSLLGKNYDLLNFNCEHLANYAQTGRVASPMVAAAVIVGLVALVLLGSG